LFLWRYYAWLLGSLTALSPGQWRKDCTASINPIRGEIASPSELIRFIDSHSVILRIFLKFKELKMTKADDYRLKLRELSEWDAYLLKESGLPGPRGNIELAQAVADEGDRQLFERFIAYTAEQAPVNSPFEFLSFCGVLGLGRLLAEGDDNLLITLRRSASDPRWRMREAVAMALQRLGEVDMGRLISEMRGWSHGNTFEQRAAAAGMCEPRLLGGPIRTRGIGHSGLVTEY
jgi:hypothetical protein